MLRIVPVSTSIDFLAKRKICIALSTLFIISTVGLLIFKGLNYGIDFSGGTLVQIQTEQITDISNMRESLRSTGMQGFSIQKYGAENEFLIRIPGADGDAAITVVNSLSSVGGKIDVRRTEFVGPQIGVELRNKGIWALCVAIFAILIYISIRFEFRFAVGAVAALIHDLVLTVGVFSLLQKEITMPVLAALLTIIGYSLNDTIVVFDRVRENQRKYSKSSLINVLNRSVNEMLNRTLMTSLTTLVVLFALYLYGGEVINDFAFTLIFGVVVGTYSSVFVASPVVLGMEKYYKKIPEDDKKVDNNHS